MTSTSRLTRRAALRRMAAAGLTAPLALQARLQAAQAQPATLNHASFGASGMAISDIRSLTASKHLRLVAVAEVDLSRTAEVQKLFPKVNIYQDWRQLLDKEKDLHSVNVSTPDHMHAPITMRAIHQGLHVYTQKPLTQTIYEARQLTTAARDRKIVSQMGIQIHSLEAHRMIVAAIQGGAIGKVREVHSWSNKQWGDRGKRPAGGDKPPANLNWDFWLGVAAERPYLNKYYHPAQWRKRLDFGTGTFGDMGCHILDPVFSALELTAPRSVRADSGAVGPDSWGLDCQVQYVFPGTKRTVDTLTLYWYDGTMRPPAKVMKLIGNRKPAAQGSIYIGSDGVLYSPYLEQQPALFPEAQFKGYKFPRPGSRDHYLEFVEACRGNGRTSTPFDYSGPLTEAVLLGCLSTRFQKQTLEWDAAKLQVTNVKDANNFVRRTYRKGWEVKGL